ncbi:MAG: hypothetical protein ACJAYB_002529, partial [Psychromonas sp.]
MEFFGLIRCYASSNGGLLNKYKEYLPEFLGVILALLLLNLWYLSSLAIENKMLPANLDYLYKGVTVLIGAFVGAF